MRHFMQIRCGRRFVLRRFVRDLGFRVGRERVFGFVGVRLSGRLVFWFDGGGLDRSAFGFGRPVAFLPAAIRNKIVKRLEYEVGAKLRS